MKFGPPKTPGVCDNPACEGAALIQRQDDCEETIRERLRVYHETTEPIAAFYAEQGILKDVAGSNLSADAIFTKIEALLSAFAGGKA